MHPTLFPLARAVDPETSQAAARRMVDKAPTIRARILEALLNYGSMTDDELCRYLEEHPRRWPSVKTARSALTHCDPPWIIWTGQERNGQRVWRHKDRRARVENVVGSL